MPDAKNGWEKVNNDQLRKIVGNPLPDLQSGGENLVKDHGKDGKQVIRVPPNGPVQTWVKDHKNKQDGDNGALRQWPNAGKDKVEELIHNERGVRKHHERGDEGGKKVPVSEGQMMAAWGMRGTSNYD